MKRRRGWANPASSVSRQWALSLCGLFLLLGQVSGQDIKIGNKLTADQLAEMKRSVGDLTKKIKDAESSKYTMLPGDFLTVEPPDSVKGPFLFLVTDDAVCKMLTINPGSPFTTYLRHAGETDAKLWEYPAKPAPWFMMIGLKEGVTTISVVVNGDGGKAPWLLDKLEITVGKPKPPIPPPDTEPFLIAAKADILAGHGTQIDLANLAAYYRTIGPSLPADTRFATLGAFDQSYATALATLVGDKTKVLPTCRRAIGDFMNKAIPTDPALPFDSALRQKMADAFAAIADRLENK